MIAHKKQFKIAGAIWLLIVMIICQIVPAFASSSDDGSFLPDFFVARWVIYNIDAGVYELADVTSRVTSSGLDFYFPYNTGGVSQIGLFLFPSSSFTFHDFYVSGAVYYDFPSSYEPVSFTSNCTLAVSSIASPSSLEGFSDFLSVFSDNPFVLTGSGAYFDITAVRFAFNVSQVSGHFWIHFDNFTFNSSDVSSLITVENLDNASQDLADLGDQLAVPTPDTDAIFNGMDDAINHVNDSNYQSTYSFFKNDTGIMATYITIVLAMATLGYIFFGKRSA